MNEIEVMEKAVDSVENVNPEVPVEVADNMAAWKGFGAGVVVAGVIALGYEFMLKPYLVKRSQKKVINDEAVEVPTEEESSNN